MKRNFLSKKPGAPKSKPKFGLGKKISTKIPTKIIKDKDTENSELVSSHPDRGQTSIKFEIKNTF